MRLLLVAMFVLASFVALSEATGSDKDERLPQLIGKRGERMAFKGIGSRLKKIGRKSKHLRRGLKKRVTKGVSFSKTAVPGQKLPMVKFQKLKKAKKTRKFGKRFPSIRKKKVNRVASKRSHMRLKLAALTAAARLKIRAKKEEAGTTSPAPEETAEEKQETAEAIAEEASTSNRRTEEAATTSPEPEETAEAKAEETITEESELEKELGLPWSEEEENDLVEILFDDRILQVFEEMYVEKHPEREDALKYRFLMMKDKLTGNNEAEEEWKEDEHDEEDETDVDH